MHDQAPNSNGQPLSIQRLPKILFNITHGFQARMLLRSKISETLLARGAELIVVSPNADEEYFRGEFDHPQIRLEQMPSRFSRVESLLINLRQYLLMNPSLGVTLNHKNEAFRRQSPKFYWLTRSLNLVLGRIGFLRRGYLALENWLYPGADFDEVLARHRPQLVVTGTPGFVCDDIHLLRAARRAGIPTATVMLSWDNLTSKGYMGARPDHLLVWSDLMADEAVQYHDFPRERIQWCGAAQFDHYYGLRQRFDRAEWRRRHGICDQEGLLVYGTINPQIMPHEINVARRIAEIVNEGRFRRSCHLWIRLHPQVVQGNTKINLEPYQALVGPRVHLEVPPVRESALSWDLPKADAEHLSSLMAAADVVIATSSTLSIDAACTGTPIVNVFWDGPGDYQAELTARRFMEYTHYRQILQTGGIAKTESEEQFAAAVDGYLVSPTLHEAERDAIVRQQMGRLDGKAGERTAEALLRLAGAEQALDVGVVGRADEALSAAGVE